MKISFDAETLRMHGLFEKVTRARLKDCIIGETSIMFITGAGEAGKAIGKKGANVHKLSNMFKKDVKIIEHSPDVIEFISKYLRNPKLKISLDGDVAVITCPDVKTKGNVYGRERSKLKELISITKRYYPISDIRIE